MATPKPEDIANVNADKDLNADFILELLGMSELVFNAFVTDNVEPEVQGDVNPTVSQPEIETNPPRQEDEWDFDDDTDNGIVFEARESDSRQATAKPLNIIGSGPLPISDNVNVSGSELIQPSSSFTSSEPQEVSRDTITSVYVGIN